MRYARALLVYAKEQGAEELIYENMVTKEFISNINYDKESNCLEVTEVKYPLSSPNLFSSII